MSKSKQSFRSAAEEIIVGRTFQALRENEPSSASVKATGQKELSLILDEIEARAEKATKGPWRVDDGSVQFALAIRPGKTGYLLASLGRDNMLYREGKRNVVDDANFIAASRTDVPALVRIAKIYVEELEFHGRRKKLAEITAILTESDTNSGDKILRK